MTRKIYTVIVVFMISLTGCQKKAVQLPVINITGLTEIQNHSSIWIFRKINGEDTTAVLNKNNKIINTHWIFNIDRDLPMNDVIPLLIQMQKDRNKDSMHKKEGMENYFSYADPSSEKICLSPFTHTSFESIGSLLQTDPCYEPLWIIDGSVKFKNEHIPIDSLEILNWELDSCGAGELKKIRMIIDEKTLFQDYLHTRVFLENKDISCDSIDYIFSVK